LTLDQLRRYALARSLFAPTTFPRAIAKLGFVQADPLRAPARAQDLTLRQRVAGYRARDLERRYARLDVEEDFVVNYGFLLRPTHHLMRQREPCTAWPRSRWRQAHAVLESCANPASCTRATSMPSSRTARCATGSADRASRAPSCPTQCTTAACYESRGHYAMPLLRGEQVIGWGNFALKESRLKTQLG